MQAKIKKNRYKTLTGTIQRKEVDGQGWNLHKVINEHPTIIT